jgi:hypothetical protein
VSCLINDWATSFERKNSVGVLDEYVCRDDQCVTTDDIVDSDVAEDEKEEVSEPLDLFDSNVQGFV